MLHQFSLSARRFALLTSCGLLLASTACQKEQDSSPSPLMSTSKVDAKEQEPIAVRGGKHLKFNTRKAFEKTMREIGNLAPGESAQTHLEKWEKAHNFLSLRAHKAKRATPQGTQASSTQNLTSSAQLLSSTQSASIIEEPTGGDEILGTYETPASEQDYLTDDFLASVLSPDYTVQIGENIYRLDAATDRIYYTSADNTTLYDELISTPTSPEIYWYPTDQNVLDLQEAGISGEPAASLRWTIGIGSGIGCGPNADRRKSEGGVIYSKNQRLDCKLVYESAGIYFSIIAKAQNQKKVLGIWWSQQASVSLLPRPGAMWEELCVGYGTSDFGSYSNSGGYGDNNTVSRRYYQSTRGLKSYNCTVGFAVGNAQAGPFHIEFAR